MPPITLQNDGANVPAQDIEPLELNFDLTPQNVPGVAGGMFEDLMGENPWDEQEREYQQELAAWRGERRKKLDEGLLNVDKVYQQPKAGLLVDEETAKTNAAVNDLLKFYTDDAPLPQDDFQRHLMRTTIAAREGFPEGSEADDATFLQAAISDATKRKTDRDFDKSLVEMAIADSKMIPWEQQGLKGHKEQLKAMPGYTPEKEHEYAERWNETRRAIDDAIQPFKGELNEVWIEMRDGDPIDGEILSRVSDEDWPLFLEVLRLRAQTHPDADKEGFWEGMGKEFDRAATDFLRNIGSTLGDQSRQAQLAEAVRPDLLFTPNMTAEERQRIREQAAQTQQQAGENLAESRRQEGRLAEVRRIFRADYDPIEAGKVASIVQKTPGVVATSMMMAVPVVGMPGMYATMEGAAKESLYLKSRDAGISEADAGQYAQDFAPVVAIPQVALERLGFKLWARKVPGFEKAMNAVSDRVTNRAVRFGLSTAGITAAETGIEVSQDLTESVVQDFSSIFSEIAPEVDWNAELRGAWNSIPEIAGTMLPLAFLGAAGGLSREAQAAAFKQSTRLEREALGLTDEANDRIDAAQSISEIAAAVDEGFKTRDPESEKAAAAQEKWLEQRMARAKAMTALKASGALPIIRAGKDGFTVLDGETREVVGTSPTVSGAWQLSRQHSDFAADMNADAVAYMATLIESADFVAKLDNGDITEIDIGTVMNEALLAAENPEQATRFAQQAALREQAAGGTGDINFIVNGRNDTEILNGLRTTVNRIYQGGSVLTVFHEFTHGKRREALAAGRITREDEIQFLRALDEILGEKRTKAGESLRFIPKDMADADISETLIDEAMSEIMEAEIIRSRDGGTMRRKPGRGGVLKVPSGFVGRNLQAIARLAPGATEKFSSFIDAVRSHFGLAMSRAAVLKKAEREGRFDAAGYEGFLANMLGLNLQDDFEAMVGEESERLELAETPFSLSRAPLLGINQDTQQKFKKAFGEDFEADEYGLPVMPKTLPEGDDLLRETDTLETAVLPADHPMVEAGLIDADTEVSREEFREKLLEFFISQGKPVAEGQKPTVFATGGGGGAGKSTILSMLRKRGDINTEGAIEVNADDIKLMIPEFRQIKEAGDGRAAAIVHEESSTLAKELMARALEAGNTHIIFDATLAKGDKTLKMMKEWKAAGFQTHLIAVTIRPIEGMTRASIRAAGSGRWVPNKDLATAHNGFLEALPKYMETADAANVYDNSDFESPKEVMEKSAGEKSISLVNPDRWNSIKSYEARPIEAQAQGLQQEGSQGGTEGAGSTGQTALREVPESQITPEEDAQYIAAVEAGDMATAQAMVEVAAYQAGYREKAFHGGAPNIEVFDRKASGRTNTLDALGTWFSTERSQVSIYRENAQIYEAFIRMDSPLLYVNQMQALEAKAEPEAIQTQIDELESQEKQLSDELRRLDETGKWKSDEGIQARKLKKGIDAEIKQLRTKKREAQENYDMNEPWQRMAEDFREFVGGRTGDVDAYVEHLKSQGYDGIKLVDTTADTESNDGTRAPIADWFLVFDPENIKTAEAVTRDSDGNVIPLSQRFDPNRKEIAFSLTQSRGLDLLQMDATSRIKDPRRRAQAFTRMARELERLKLAAERLEILAGTKRLRKSLQKEAATREALRREELEEQAYAQHWQVLSDDDLTKIKSQPVHAYLSDPDSPMRGRLLSLSRAIKTRPEMFGEGFKGGEWDGSAGVSRSVFGGDLNPADAAQNLYDEGLIDSPYPDAMWEALAAEQATVDKMKQAMAKAKEDLRMAREQAKQEVNEWLKEQIKTQEENYSPKQEILRALATLDAIMAALPPAVRGKIGGYTQLARIGTEEKRLEFLKEKLAKADSELEGWMRSQLDREFRELIARAKPDRDEAGRRPVGKITADMHTLFRQVEEAMLWDGPTVEAEVAKQDALAQNEQVSEDDRVQASMLSKMYDLAGNWKNASADRMERALTNAANLFYGGYMEARIQAAQNRERIMQKQDALIQSVGSTGERMERVKQALKTKGSKVARAKQALLSLYSFDQLLELVFGKQSAEAKRLAEWELHAANAKEDAIQNAHDQVETLLIELAGGDKLKAQKLRYDLAENQTVVWTDPLGNEQTASELEAVSLTLMWAQEDGKRHMMGKFDDDGNLLSRWAYTQATMDKIESQLSDNAKVIRHFLKDQYAAEYDRINAVYRDLYGVDMPRHKNYAPIKVQPFKTQGREVEDPVAGGMIGPGITPGSLKVRSHTAVAEPEPVDALTHFIAHTKQMEHFIAYGKFSKELNALMGNREMMQAIQGKGDKALRETLSSWVAFFTEGGHRDAAAHLASTNWLSRGLDRLTQSILVGRASVLAVQSVQLGAAAYQMPTGSYLKRLALLFSGRLGWGAAIKSDYIQRRIAEMPPAVQQAMNSLRHGRPTRLKFQVEKLGRLISGADGLFTAGTYAIIYDYQLKLANQQGIPNPERYAHRQAEILTDKVAQPMRPGARSLIENRAGAYMRVMWAFASEPRQKIALVAHGLQTGQGINERMKPLIVTWLVSGVAQSILRAAIRDIRDNGDDDEIFDGRNWDIASLSLQSLTGPFGGLPIVGDIIEETIWGVSGQYLPTGGMLQSVPKGVQTAKKVLMGEAEMENLLKDVEKILQGAAPFSETAAGLTSFSHIARDLEALIRNLTD